MHLNVMTLFTDFGQSSRLEMSYFTGTGLTDIEVPPFIATDDTYSWCSCGRGDCRGCKTLNRGSTSDFLADCVQRLGAEAALAFEYKNGHACISKHVLGGAMSAPMLYDVFDASGHTHPYSAYCVEKCFIGYASAEDFVTFVDRAIESGVYEWHMVPALEGTYYYKVTRLPQALKKSNVRQPILDRIGKVWHGNRLSRLSKTAWRRWGPAQYLRHLHQLTWGRLCSGDCEAYGWGCETVRACDIPIEREVFDNPFIVCFFNPNILEYSGVLVHGMNLHKHLDLESTTMACNDRSRAPVIVSRERKLVYSMKIERYYTMWSDETDLNNLAFGQHRPNRLQFGVATSQVYGKPSAMSPSDFRAHRDHIMHLMFSIPASQRAKLVHTLNTCDINRCIDMYKAGQEKYVTDAEARDAIHMPQWHFNEFDMDVYTSNCRSQRYFFLTSERLLPLFEQLRNWMVSVVGESVDIHELPRHESRRLGLGGMCRPFDVHWGVISDRCRHEGPLLGYGWRKKCNLGCAGHVIYMAIPAGEITHKVIKQLKKLILHELTHRDLNDVMWFNHPIGNHSEPFHDVLDSRLKRIGFTSKD